MEHYTNPNIHKAFRALQALSADGEARQLAEMRERALSDEVSELNAARLEGERIGEIRGEKRGETRGERKGMRRLVVETLKLRFHVVPDKIMEKLEAVKDLDALGSIHRQSVTADSLGAFENTFFLCNSTMNHPFQVDPFTNGWRIK